jgi:hypothetical protein
MIGFVIAGALALFFLMAFVLSHDDRSYGWVIRIFEILLPLGAAVWLYQVASQDHTRGYAFAAFCFGAAAFNAIWRKVPSVWFKRPLEGHTVFVYSFLVAAGAATSAVAYLHLDIPVP